MTFEELPEEWQAEFRRLASANKSLRKGQGYEVKYEDLPLSWQREFTRLRRDIARLRVQRNEARAELAALRAELEARSK
ncbi:hypothetical protein LIX17_20210 [Mycobacterium avium subsp. hominissuis]|uniref:Uncharacterized protein n=2 Tax=Mycobacterium avium TaxID=1764 RepID=A0A2A3L0Q0_MYCAV|nr:hypothetical protein [Mycobacterium avium]ETZ53574.1 hypothetical protein L838_2055 [Mycobacterium avium MAV_120709_2344]MCA4733641.1 hypothetical protein [Mycobacterium avium subsp. hominissuis]MCA4737760.1 hypothetical protein [Mycobacterium avium subsp. hominissuis]MCA4744149.1 hypothetical protein [Mycobacterium avium subsp. hominissuis]MCA4764880.1 hypothetical protein [Mycobacterium avium subsp. hominissuis]